MIKSLRGHEPISFFSFLHLFSCIFFDAFIVRHVSTRDLRLTRD